MLIFSVNSITNEIFVIYQPIKLQPEKDLTYMHSYTSIVLSSWLLESFNYLSTFKQIDIENTF